MSRIRCSAVLFDLDGVLVDSRPVVERTWRRWAARNALDLPDLVSRAHGRRSVETVREVAPLLDAEAEARWLAALELSDTDGLAALPGAAALYGAVPGHRRAVVTSGGLALARLRLTHVGLDAPGVLIAAEDVESGKPSPDGYLAAATRLGFDAGRCLVIEDTPAGVAAGRAAGAVVLGVSGTFPRAQLRAANYVVDSLAGIDLEQAGGELELSFGDRSCAERAAGVS